MRLLELRSKIAEKLREKIPGVTVIEFSGRFGEEEVSRQQARLPAVFVGLLGGTDPKENGAGTSFSVQALAVVAARPIKGKTAGDVGLAFVEMLAQVVAGEDWDLDYVASGKNLRWENLYSAKLDGAGVQLHGLAWEHVLEIGTGVDESKLAAFLKEVNTWSLQESTVASDAADEVQPAQ